MKKILVPTDFSENAKRALNYAVALNKGMESEIHLVHSFQIATSSAGRFVALDEMVKKEREEELQGVIEQVAATTALQGRVVEGYAIDVITEEATRQHADYIVMGTLGASGIKKIFMGSTTSNVIRNTKVPVLAVPDEAPDFRLQNILIALDADTLTDPAVLNPVLHIAKKFNATVSLLHITNSKDDNISPSIQAFLKSMGFDYVYYKLHDNTDAKTILDFAKQKNIDLVCTLSRHHSWFSQLFQTSVSQQLAFSATIPLLVLPV